MMSAPISSGRRLVEAVGENCRTVFGRNNAPFGVYSPSSRQLGSIGVLTGGSASPGLKIFGTFTLAILWFLPADAFLGCLLLDRRVTTPVAMCEVLRLTTG
jgi:hypothetical protein